MITYFVHSTSVDNEKQVLSGWSDSQLSKRGQFQADSLKNRLSNQHFESVYCSDLARARDTAQIAFLQLNLRPLREQSGDNTLTNQHESTTTVVALIPQH